LIFWRIRIQVNFAHETERRCIIYGRFTSKGFKQSNFSNILACLFHLLLCGSITVPLDSGGEPQPPHLVPQSYEPEAGTTRREVDLIIFSLPSPLDDSTMDDRIRGDLIQLVFGGLIASRSHARVNGSRATMGESAASAARAIDLSGYGSPVPRPDL
jgi:hypothetical protein